MRSLIRSQVCFLPILMERETGEGGGEGEGVVHRKDECLVRRDGGRGQQCREAERMEFLKISRKGPMNRLRMDRSWDMPAQAPAHRST